MRKQFTVPSDGSFSGHGWQVVTNSGDEGQTVTEGHFGAQSENDYTQLKQQNTLPGDGSFSGIGIPSPLQMEGDGGGSQTSGFPSHDFMGFNAPGEASQSAGPTSAPSNGMPTSGAFPGDGTGFAPFNRQNER